jgi:glycosyltransferase involved in cell wall biosynthesis
MTLGLFFIGNPGSGGIYQYALSILDSLKNRKEKVIVFSLGGSVFPAQEYRGYFRESNTLKTINFLKHALTGLFNKVRPVKLAGGKNSSGAGASSPKEQTQKEDRSTFIGRTGILFLRWLIKLNRVKLMIFTTHSNFSFELKVPYIMPVHDLQHRLNPQFPEVTADGLWQRREYFFKNCIPHAEMILTDSETGKEDVLKFYTADEKKVKVLPYPPPNYLRRDYSAGELARIRDKYQLPEKFLFYPANFWPHKNHKLIIEALNHLKTNHGLTVHLVLVGTNPDKYGQLDTIQELINKYLLNDQVHYCGYIPNEEMGLFYKLAEALVMPTFFGPTNIPYQEAFTVGCPIIGTDIRGIREQIGDAGLLIDPGSPESLAGAILEIFTVPGTRDSLIKKGYDKAEAWNFKKFSETLNGYVDEAEERLGHAG